MKIDSSSKSFVSILKSTIIFGSTQIFQMIIMLIKSKVSAVLLGPFGLGLYTIMQTTVLTIAQTSSLGIFQSGIKVISVFNNDPEKKKLNNAVSNFLKLSNLLGLLSLFLMVILSSTLSKVNFNNYSYILSFSLLGIATLFYITSNKQLTILQATRQTKRIAIYSLLSAFVSLIIAAIFYKSFGINGIVPSIILSYIIQSSIGYYLTKEFKVETKYSIKSIFSENKQLLNLGIVLMISGLLINIYTLALNAIISNFGKVEDLGLFNAAFSITNGNILVLLTVLSSDYYPRLASNIHNKTEIRLIVNQQTELLTLIIAPLIVFLITFSYFIVRFLLSGEFIIIVPILKLMSIGLLFRVVWQSMSYIILSNGDRKTYFFYDALLGNGFVFVCNVFFYFAFGLDGLGFSFVFSSIVVSILLVFVVRIKYNLYYNLRTIVSFIISLLISIGVYLLSIYNDSISLLLPFLLLSSLYSIYIIFNRSGMSLIPSIRRRFK